MHSAKVLLQLTQKELGQGHDVFLGDENPSLSHHYERKLGFRIWHNDSIIAQSRNAAELSGVEAEPGFSNQRQGKYSWRFFVFIDAEHHIRIETFERYDVRYELIYQLMSALALPLLLVSPALFLIVWFGARRALKPVTDISRDVDRRNSMDLAPIKVGALPGEVAPLVTALNRLFARLQESFQREREFTDHAAHELRTPLAAMKTQTQVLLRKSKSMPEFAEGLANLETSINRATHLVSQLLALARLQSEDFPKALISLSALCHEAADAAAEDAVRKSITLESDITEGIHISGHGDTVAILLRNLLDNALRYTPEGGRVRISLDARAEWRYRTRAPASAMPTRRAFSNVSCASTALDKTAAALVFPSAGGSRRRMTAISSFWTIRPRACGCGSTGRTPR